MAKNRVDAGRGRGKRVVKGAGGARGGDKRGFYVVLAIAGIAGIAILAYVATSSGGRITTLANVTPIANEGHVLGSDSAPIEVVEFADFECPACGTFANLTEPDVRARLVHTGIIRFRFMDFPLDIHPNTGTAHMAAWCAGDQGKFWMMHDLIFQNQDRWATHVTRRPASVMGTLAEQAGLNMDQYESCMDTGKFAAQIKANYDAAIARGVPSTPTFIIGNKLISDLLTYDEFKRHVDEALAATPRRPAARPDSLKLDPPRESRPGS